MSVNRTSLGKRISFYRSKSNLTQEALAAKVNCSREYIVQIENGTKVPSLSVLVKIANTLSVSADELLLDCLEWTKANKPTAGRTKAIHRRLELSFDLYLLLLFVGQNRASKSHLI